jgi:hypothetical protein
LHWRGRQDRLDIELDWMDLRFNFRLDDTGNAQAQEQ